ncbi:MAG: hypothetical protein JWP52_2882 [Rhizobacter sp.]|nr:hypothetical protein [Rhizobacter sp.]
MSSWLQSAMKTWEIVVAAPQVVAVRSAQMAMAGAVPSVRDRREFALMSEEKVDAFGRSMQAMALPLWASQTVLAQTMTQQWLHAVSPWVFRRPTGKALDRSMRRLVEQGLAPVHSAVTANARRLLKRGR